MPSIPQPSFTSVGDRLAVAEINDERAPLSESHAQNFEKILAWQEKRIPEMKALILVTYSADQIELMLNTGMRPAGC